MGNVWGVQCRRGEMLEGGIIRGEIVEGGMSGGKCQDIHLPPPNSGSFNL